MTTWDAKYFNIVYHLYAFNEDDKLASFSLVYIRIKQSKLTGVVRLDSLNAKLKAFDTPKP